jgi:dihydrofolate reductase
MSIKCSVYIATSTDGFIAKPDGDIEWLHRPEYSATALEGLSYDDFISTVDALVMGRNTFEKVLSFDSWPYEATPVVALSSSELDIPQHLKELVRVESSSPEELVSMLASEGMQHLYIDGGVTIQRFLQAGLIHEITITHIPVLLGAGIPLFGSLGSEVPLRLLAATSSDNGFVQLRYEVTGKQPCTTSPG